MPKGSDELDIAINAIRGVYQDVFGEKLSDNNLYALLLDRKIKLREKFESSYLSTLDEKDVVKAMAKLNANELPVENNVEQQVNQKSSERGRGGSKGKAR